MKRFLCAAVLGSALLMLGPSGGQFTRASAQWKPTGLTIERVNRWEMELSNWGRWGKDDERGAIEPHYAAEGSASGPFGEGWRHRFAGPLRQSGEGKTTSISARPSTRCLGSTSRPTSLVLLWTASASEFTTAPTPIWMRYATIACKEMDRMGPGIHSRHPGGHPAASRC